jgi:hypothetical protein
MTVLHFTGPGARYSLVGDMRQKGRPYMLTGVGDISGLQRHEGETELERDERRERERAAQRRGVDSFEARQK